MADTKISALPSATTPLAGTEVLPIVQSGATDKVSVANLTAGRTVSMSALGVGVTTPTEKAQINDGRLRFLESGQRQWNIGINAGTSDFIIADATFSYTPFTISGTGQIVANTGNFVFGTAAKGVNFTANTPAAGMTSQLLNWYEEGAWTPTIGATSGTITTSGSTNCRYTRIGRTVTLTGNISITTNGTGAGGITISGLPFAAASASAGGGIAREGSVDGKTSSITQIGSTTTFAMYRYDNTYPGSDGASFNFQITYIV